MTQAKDKTELKRPNSPQDNGQTHSQGSTDIRARGTSTAITHGVRTALNQHIDHVSALQDAASEALSPVIDEASDFMASVVSGEFLWQSIADRTKEKLSALPKQERVELGVKSLKPASITPSNRKGNKYLTGTTFDI
jgi:flagellar hook-basal body complex protein FliE